MHIRLKPQRALGLVQNAEDDTVRLVEDLVRTNIRGNCLILVVIPMSGKQY